MKRILAILLSVVVLLLAAVPVSAADNPRKPVTPPELKSLTFVHYAKPVKPPKDEPVPEDTYKLLGLYLPSTVSYSINTAGAPAGSEGQISAAFDAWDAAVSSIELFDDAFGYTAVSGMKIDGQNTVSWAKIAPPKAIAVTNLWYLDDGDPSTPNPIIEFDMVFNTFMKWGIDEDGEGSLYYLNTAYDVCNIATHEVGHVVGLADLYDSGNSYLTMYGYGSIGETIKISLADGDIEGANIIY